MANQRLSSRYANSILQIAQESKSLDKVFGDMEMISESISGSTDLQSMLKSPIISPENKASVLDKIFSSKVEKSTAGFLKLLVTKGRESHLQEICKSFIEEYNIIHKIADVTLVTAIPATKAIIEEVTALLKKTGNYSKISINEEVDASIIGGFILKMDDQLLDNSIQRKLKVVRKELQN